MLHWFWTGSDIGHNVPCRAQRCSEPSTHDSARGEDDPDGAHGEGGPHS